MTKTIWQLRFSNWSCGVLTALISLTFGSQVLRLYGVIADHSPLHFGVSPLTMLVTFIALDVLYYAQHRAEHRVKWLWRMHAVHHQSTLMDTSVSLRTSMFAPLTVLSLHLVLAVLGVPFKAYFPMYLLHTALVFMLHSKTPKWFDRAGWVFNSPYLHRAHHSNDARLRGKNFGGVLIVWDRLLGTFEGHCDGATSYGIGKRETPLNPFIANLG